MRESENTKIQEIMMFRLILSLDKSKGKYYRLEQE